MLSRTAENLYWLARYVERAEYLARTIEATLRVTALPNAYIGQTNEWDSALLTAGRQREFLRGLQRSRRAQCRRIPVVLAKQSLLDPQLHRKCAAQFPLGTNRADRRDVGHHQTRPGSIFRKSGGKGTKNPRGNSRNSCGSCRKPRCGSTARPTGPCCATMPTGFSRLGLHLERADNTARILDVKYHVLLPEQETCRRTARLLSMDLDPALGLGADGLSLGLSGDPQAMADRRSFDPQRFTAAFAGQLLRQPGAQSRPDRLSPMAARAPRNATPVASATAWSTAIWTTSSSTACMNSSRNSSRTIRGLVKSSPGNI